MENFKIIQLLVKRLKKQLSVEEKLSLNEWSSLPENKAQAGDIEKVWELTGQYKKGYEPDVEAGLKRFKDRINQEQQPKRPTPRRRILYWVSAAAAAVLLLLWQPWISFSDTSSPNELVVTTTLGEEWTVTLPDGSSVFLNENSQLIYPEDWSDESVRTVQLQGEAFFDIEENKDQPFLIEAGDTRIAVLGTAFNVRAYADEPTTEVMVESGVVEFYMTDRQQLLKLKKAEKGVCEHLTGTIYLEENSGLNARAWQQKQLSFRDTPLREVVRSLEHYFRTQITVENNALNQCSFTFENARPEDLPTLLETMEVIFEVEVRQRDETSFILEGGNCIGR